MGLKAWIAGLGVWLASSALQAKTCVIIHSYHTGYSWTDDIDKGMEKKLKGHCTVEKFYMDTKRNPGGLKQKGQEAKAFIEEKKADVVLLSDDNAVTEVLLNYFKDSKIPFVFCGVNWTIEQYGLPFKNTTGMIEVAAVHPLIDELKRGLGKIKAVTFLSVDNESERKEFNHVEKLFKSAGMTVKGVFVKTMADWKAAYLQAQKDSDYIHLANFAGINDWNKDEAIKTISENLTKPSVTNHDWMLPYTLFAVMKSGEEQGEWAAESAIKIMGGTAPTAIKVVTNKRADYSYNPTLVEKAKYKLSPQFSARATKWEGK